MSSVRLRDAEAKHVEPGPDQDTTTRAKRWREGPRPSTLTAEGIRSLNATVGNAAVARLFAAGAQPKLQVGPAGDQYEREADRVADEVMRLTSTRPANGDDNRLRRAPAGEPDADATVGLEGGPVGADVERTIQSARQGGRPLPSSVRHSMEGALGADLAGVRLHTGAQADSLNQGMQSRAFTVGPDIFFAKGQYQPGSSGGQWLLAHELTHTLQQGAVAPVVHRKYLEAAKPYLAWTRDTSMGATTRRSSRSPAS